MRSGVLGSCSSSTSGPPIRPAEGIPILRDSLMVQFEAMHAVAMGLSERLAQRQLTSVAWQVDSLIVLNQQVR